MSDDKTMDAPDPPFETTPWMPFESRRRARDEKREAVLRMAVHLFVEQGYHRATLAEVASRLNITKPALYNYFRSKEEILFECCAMGKERVDEVIAAIDAGNGNGLAKLRKLIRAYAEVMMTDFGAALIRSDVRDLTADDAKILSAAKRSIDLTFRRYVAEGIEDGSVRPCDCKLAAFAIAGSLNWIGHWYRRDGALSAAEIAVVFADRLTEGLAALPGKSDPAARPKKKNSGGGKR